MIRLDKLTIKAQEALQASQGIAEEAASQTIEPEHLLFAGQLFLRENNRAFIVFEVHRFVELKFITSLQSIFAAERNN